MTVTSWPKNAGGGFPRGGPAGTIGRPKGCQHRTGGYLAYVAGTSKYIQDIHPTDMYWCFADIVWITGHSCIVYGPLALAATSVNGSRA